MQARRVVAAGHHRYHPAYDTDYYGAKFDDGHPYVEVALRADRVVLLALFSVEAGTAADGRWIYDGAGWSIGTGTNRVSVTFAEQTLRVNCEDGSGWTVPL